MSHTRNFSQHTLLIVFKKPYQLNHQKPFNLVHLLLGKYVVTGHLISRHTFLSLCISGILKDDMKSSKMCRLCQISLLFRSEHIPLATPNRRPVPDTPKKISPAERSVHRLRVEGGTAIDQVPLTQETKKCFLYWVDA
jgi:hypothetical protein